MPKASGILIVLGVAGAGLAIINPNFSPAHLVEQSDLILAGAVQATGKPLQWRLAETACLKGKAPRQQLLDLAAVNKDHLDGVLSALKQPGEAILFAGTFQEQKRAFLSAGGMWLAMKAAGQGRWSVQGFSPQMSATYAGGTDMLIRMSEYLVKDPDAGVPVSAGVRWMDHRKLGKLPGAPAGMAAVEVKGAGPDWLFVASPAGDRLYRPDEDKETLVDVTVKSGLDSKSRQFAWLDVNADGAADLVSWDGSALSVRLAGKDGTFRPAKDAAPVKLDADCLGLSACSPQGAPGVLVSTYARPVLLTAGPGGAWKKHPLPGGKADALPGAVGLPSACIVADLDGDGFADVLRPGEKGGILWKGSARGFAAPVGSPVCSGGGQGRAALGDFNADGALDVFLGSPDGNGLWESDGTGGFKDVLRHAGSMSYKCPTGVSDVRAADLNHDGRQDLCLAYAGGDLLYHWNRGYRCFAEEGEVRLAPSGADAAAERVGPRALALGDFNGDHSQDLAVILANGELQVYFNDHMDMPGVRLRLKRGLPGPVTVSCWAGDTFKVCLGVAAVGGQSAPAYLSARQPGRLTIRYRLPGRAARTKAVTVADSAADVLLDAAPAPAATQAGAGKR